MLTVARPHLYLVTHSLKFDGTGAAATFTFAASFDGSDFADPTKPLPAPDAFGEAEIRWEIRKVRRIRTQKLFKRKGTPLDGTPVFRGTARVATASINVFNRDEVGCGWKEITELIPDVSPITRERIESGLYVLIVQNADEGRLDAPDTAGKWNFRYNYFVVRRPGPAVRILLCYPFSTVAAYSGADRAVSGGGSNSLYDTEAGGRLRRVSLDRPQVASQWGDDKEEQCIAYPFWMEQFIRDWAARNLGPDAVDVCTSFDLNGDPTLLHDGIALFLSVGHDEYWSTAMRKALQAFVAEGGNAAFFSANVAWWQVRFEDRVMVCYKSAVEDPDSGSEDELVTANFVSAAPAPSWRVAS